MLDASVQDVYMRALNLKAVFFKFTIVRLRACNLCGFTLLLSKVVKSLSKVWNVPCTSYPVNAT